MSAVYDKENDPFRTDEVKAREVLQHASPVGSFHIRQQGRFTSGNVSTYASVAVIGWRDEEDRVFHDKPYSVHTAVIASDGETPSVRLINGVYDLTQSEAQTLLSRQW